MIKDEREFVRFVGIEEGVPGNQRALVAVFQYIDHLGHSVHRLQDDGELAETFKITQEALLNRIKNLNKNRISPTASQAALRALEID